MDTVASRPVSVHLAPSAAGAPAASLRDGLTAPPGRDRSRAVPDPWSYSLEAHTGGPSKRVFILYPAARGEVEREEA